jgi:hypothetical protein
VHSKNPNRSHARERGRGDEELKKRKERRKRRGKGKRKEKPCHQPRILCPAKLPVEAESDEDSLSPARALQPRSCVREARDSAQHGEDGTRGVRMKRNLWLSEVFVHLRQLSKATTVPAQRPP